VLKKLNLTCANSVSRPTWVAHRLPKVSHCLIKDVVTVSSRDTDSHFDLSIFEVAYSNS
jgi:hypothetical protein